MLPYFSEIFGNASSNHIYGKEAKKAIEKARTHVAEIINAKIEERAVIARTKVQRDDHTKSLLDTLQNQVGGKKSQGKDGADPNKPNQKLFKKEKNLQKQQKVANGEAPPAKKDNTPLTPEQKAERNKNKKAAQKARKGGCE